METKIREVSIEEYEKLCDQFRGSLRIEGGPPEIADPISRSMYTEDEIDAFWENHLNPPNPPFIQMYTLDGMDIIRPKRGLT